MSGRPPDGPQVSPIRGVLSVVDASPRAKGHLLVLESVRCLDCGEVYAKPGEGGTVEQNPGCPKCGYVGWLSVSLPVERRFARPHSGGDRPPRPSVLPH